MSEAVSQPFLGSWSSERTGRVVHWILRVSIFACFVGHGAFGLRQKPDWLAFTRPFGLPDDLALSLMPLIGSVDILLGCVALVWPFRFALMYTAFWGVFTAFLRPVAGQSFFEVIERAGNFGPSMALLIGTAGAALLSAVPPRNLSSEPALHLARRVLTATTFLLLLGHGGLAALGKPMLVEHWASVGLVDVDPGGVLFTRVVGLLEITAAFVVLLRPTVALCLGIACWKLATEALFLTAGAPFWEVVERGGSYGAPLALAVILRAMKDPK